MPDRSLWPTVRKVGNKYEYGSLTFWADGGGIYCHDRDPGEQLENVSITMPKWRDRIEEMTRRRNHLCLSSHEGNSAKLAIQAQQIQSFDALLTAMEEVARQVQKQGDIMDPGTQKYLREHVAKVKRTHLVGADVLPAPLVEALSKTRTRRLDSNPLPD